MVEERDGGGAVVGTWVWGAGEDELVETSRGGALHYYYADHLGSSRVVTDGNGNVVERYEYADYGIPTVMDGGSNILSNSAIGNEYLYAGQRYDEESGFSDFKIRHFDPLTGRFVARIPWESGGAAARWATSTRTLETTR